MGAASKKARKIRRSEEFNGAALTRELRTPNESPAAYAWSLPDIIAARDQQMRGQFRRPAEAAASMRTDDALFVAYTNRLDALASVEVEMVAAPGARGATVSTEADALFGQTGIACSPDTMRDFHGCLVNHNVSFALVTPVPREDGARIDYTMQAWPIKHVRWDAHRRCYVTQVDGLAEEEIHHGDGRWVVAQLGENDPFQSAPLLAALLVWARHAFAARDWAKGSIAHGNAKVIGKLAESMPLQVKNADGTTSWTPDALAFMEVLKAIGSGDSPVGIIPAGASVEYLTNDSAAYQVWTELVSNAEKAGARIYLGTDGVLGSNGGAPGVDITALFGVAMTKVQGDRKAIERALQTGLIEPWCAMNFGSSALAPYRKYKLPDADADAERAAEATRTEAFHAEIQRTRANGFVVDQALVDRIAKKHGVASYALPAASASKAPTIALAPTDIANVVSVNEARASAGLGPLMTREGAPDVDGFMTVGEYKAKKEAAAKPPAAPALRDVSNAAE